MLPGERSVPPSEPKELTPSGSQNVVRHKRLKRDWLNSMCNLKIPRSLMSAWNAAKREEKCKSDGEFVEKLLCVWYTYKSNMIGGTNTSSYGAAQSDMPFMSSDDSFITVKRSPDSPQAEEEFQENTEQNEEMEEEYKASKEDRTKDEIDTFLKYLEMTKGKEKVPVSEENDEKEGEDSERRKSQRVLKRGFRPNYAVVDWNMGEEGEDKAKEEEGMEEYSSDAVIVKQENTDVDSDVEEFRDTHKQPVVKRKLQIKISSKKKKKVVKENDPDFEIKDTDANEGGSDTDATESYSDEELEQNDETKQEGKEKKPGKQRSLKKKEWISVKLEDYPDKYTVESTKSFARKDRKVEVTEDMYFCLICTNFKCGDKVAFEVHLEQHVNKVLECGRCGFIGNSEKRISDHRITCQKWASERYTCELCGEVVRKSLKKSHLGQAHNMAVYKCIICKEMFQTFGARVNHMKLEHPDDCNYCKSCKKCKPSLSKEKFEEHKRSCEEEQQCQICGTFIYRNGLQKHMNGVHGRIRKFKCEHCPYMSHMKTQLARHMRVHTGEHPYRCDQCAFSCVQHGQLRSHMRTHNGEKPYKCNLCKYAAAWNVQLKSHMQVHGMDTAVNCSDCDIMFKNEKCLKLHLKKDH